MRVGNNLPEYLINSLLLSVFLRLLVVWWRGRQVSRGEFQSAVEVRRPEVGKDVSLWVSILALISDAADEWQSSVEAMFAGFDEDGDGHITVLEFVRGLKALGVQLTSSDQVVAFAREIDTDGDGEVRDKAAAARRWQEGGDG